MSFIYLNENLAEEVNTMNLLTWKLNLLAALNIPIILSTAWLYKKRVAEIEGQPLAGC